MGFFDYVLVRTSLRMTMLNQLSFRIYEVRNEVEWRNYIHVVISTEESETNEAEKSPKAKHQ